MSSNHPKRTRYTITSRVILTYVFTHSEHPITEYITGLDLVEQMIRVAAGQKLPFKQSDIKINGWAFESRVYAEDPEKYLPSIGKLTKYIEPQGKGDVRCDSGIVEGSDISIYYDPMICKLCTWGETRDAARHRMEKALDEYVIKGVTHNVPLLRDVISHPRFAQGRLSTGFLPEEYPSGFKGHQLTPETKKELLAVAGYIFARRDLRNRTWLQGGGTLAPLHQNRSKWDLFLSVGANAEPQHLIVKTLKDGSFEVKMGEDSVTVTAEWPLDSSLIHASLGEKEAESRNVTLQYVEAIPLGFRLQHYGTKVNLFLDFSSYYTHRILFKLV